MLSFSFSDAPWRYYLRQEPDAAIPHVRIRAGAAREGGPYRDNRSSSSRSNEGAGQSDPSVRGKPL